MLTVKFWTNTGLSVVRYR